MARVEFRNIVKRFADGSTALKDFSLAVEDGELVVLVGPSGCGKSTTLRLLAGLEEATTGEILIDGRRVNETPPQGRNIAMVFQNYALYPHMTVRKNLEFPLRMAHEPAQVRKRKVAEIASILALSSLLDRKPKQLSGGQRQRVAMGRALVRNPSVFLLDEPLSNLDAKLRARIRSEIAALQRKLGKTTLYVTHDQVEAMTLGDRVAVLNDGELQQVGTPRQLYEQPANSFVGRFIGSPGMNILPARVVERTGEIMTVELGNRLLAIPETAVRIIGKPLLQAGQSLQLGIRPEAFRTVPSGGTILLEVVIDTVEFLGHESLVHFFLADGEEKEPTGLRLIARLPGRFEEPPGTAMAFHFDPRAVHLFASS